jgi:acyl-CoA dehydrogenase
MDFELSEEHKMIQSLARDFVTEQLRPLERDLLGRSADLSDAGDALPPEKEAALVSMVAGMGLWNIGVPEELGGAGLDNLGVCLVEEELAQTVVPFRFGDVSPLLFECNPEQRERYLDPVLTGEKRALLAVVGAAGPARDSLDAVTGIPEEGGFRLNGSKVSFSRFGEDYFAIVFARTEKGYTCFLVDRDTPGFRVTGGEERHGWMAQVHGTLTLHFEDCLVPVENILGQPCQAFRLGQPWLAQRRVVRSARSVGIGRRLLEEAAAHAQSLTVFGKPISIRLNIQAALADMAVNIHAAALMVYEAACNADTGKSVARAASVVKLATTQMLHSVADRVSHIFNGPSFVKGLPMERLCRSILEDHALDVSLARLRNRIARDILEGVRV